MNRPVVALNPAGWSPGQLEQELRDNAWLTVPAQEGLLFDTPLETRWEAAAALLGVSNVAQPDRPMPGIREARPPLAASP